MSRRVLTASFDSAHNALGAARALHGAGLEVVDAFGPHPIHGLEDALGWRGSRLPFFGICCGALGVAFILWFQLWTSAVNWRINVGGRPWNSSLAFLAVTFEVMVLSAGLGTVLAFLVKARLFPGKRHTPRLAGVTDDRFALVVAQTDAAFDPAQVSALLAPFAPVALDEQLEETR